MSTEPIPIVILGGSDRKAVELPDSGADKHPITGYKGVDIRIGGRPLVSVAVERLRAVGAFDPVYVAGPARAYGDLDAPFELIDTNRTFGHNIEFAVETVRRRHPGSPVGFITCDVVPELDDLRPLVERYQASRPCDLWFPIVRAPGDRGRLGASAWKPGYRIAPAPGAEPVAVLPGHLVIADTGALRLRFIYRLIQLGYDSRNRPIARRRAVLLRGVILELLYQDLLHLLSFRVPNLTWSVLRAGLPASGKLRAGTITVPELEHTLRQLFATYRHRRRHPERRVRTPIVDALSLALDIDTEEEARDHGGEVSSGAGAS